MKKTAFILIIACIVSLFSSCSETKHTERTFVCMDTVCTIKAAGEGADGLIGECESLLNDISSELDIYSSDSAVYSFNTGNETDNEYVLELYRICETLKNETNGYFSPTLGSLTILWTESQEKNGYPDNEMIRGALTQSKGLVAESNGVLKKENPQTKLDFGAVAKGYAADKAVLYLREHGSSSALISFSSTIAAVGSKNAKTPWKVAIRSPFDNGYIGTVDLYDGEFLSVSGDYERGYVINGKSYCHILSPFDGLPVSGELREVAVICDSGARSDAFSTALFVMGVEKGKEYCDKHGLSAIFVTSDSIIFCGGAKERFSPSK